MNTAQSQADVVEEVDESFESQTLVGPEVATPSHTQISFTGMNNGFNLGTNHGAIYATFVPTETFFGSLAIQDHSKHSFFISRTTLLNKARLQSGRRVGMHLITAKGVL
jgi:hypothetical protein